MEFLKKNDDHNIVPCAAVITSIINTGILIHHQSIIDYNSKID